MRPMHEALAAAGRSLEIPASADAYGWLVGSWELQVVRYWGVDVSRRGIRGEAHFEWVLEGRAVQDVWIMPSERGQGLDPLHNMFGTTLRVWDPALGAWRITWVDPAGNHREEQIGRRSGDEVVQVGRRKDGTVTRWRFTGIEPDAFHWLGETLEADGETWRIEGEFRAVRLPVGRAREREKRSLAR